MTGGCRNREQLGKRKTERTWWGMAGTMQFLAWLILAICLLPGVTTTQHHPGTGLSGGVDGSQGMLPADSS